MYMTPRTLPRQRPYRRARVVGLGDAIPEWQYQGQSPPPGMTWVPTGIRSSATGQSIQTGYWSSPIAQAPPASAASLPTTQAASQTAGQATVVTPTQATNVNVQVAREIGQSQPTPIYIMPQPSTPAPIGPTPSAQPTQDTIAQLLKAFSAANPAPGQGGGGATSMQVIPLPDSPPAVTSSVSAPVSTAAAPAQGFMLSPTIALLGVGAIVFYMMSQKKRRR